MTHTPRYRKILVPVDGSGWAQRAIPHAVDIARSNGSEIILLHVFRPPAIEYADQLALAGQDDQLNILRDQMRNYLDGLASELKSEDVTVTTELLEGPGVASIICDFAKAESVDLIVMSTHGRSGLMQLLLGSTANQVMHNTDTPVLLVRPDKA